jgi:NADH-quinone oxidoreductase subunit H
MELGFLIEKSILIFAVFAITLLIATYATLAERKVASFIQDRIGPNRAGPLGLFQPLADAVKFFTKEEIIPTHAHKVLFILGPSIAMLTACMTSAVIPWGPDIEAFGRTISLQAADLNIGILYIIGVLSLGVYGIMIGGWASNNKFSLLGAIRASSQMISYELAMGLAIIAILIMGGSVSLRDIVEAQHGANWNILYQPLGFLIFMTCALAETNRAPFDLPECETELVGGYHTEYSGMKLGLYMFAEYVNVIISSAVISILYFGGYNYPGMDALAEALGANFAAITGVIVFFLKIFVFIFIFMWIRWTLPRFRYDQLMRLGWQILIPAAIINIMYTSALKYFIL